MGLELAARRGDPIEHTHREEGGGMGLLAGAFVGVLLVVAFPIAVPAILGAGLLAGIFTAAAVTSTVVGTAMLGESIGENAGAGSAKKNAGDIADGASTVFIGQDQGKAARMSDPLDCHAGQTIAEGSDSVFIERWNASRKGDATQCDGKIQDGCPTVLIGGDAIGRAGSASRSELDGWYQDMLTGLSWTSTLTSFATTGTGLAFAGVGLALQTYSSLKLPGAQTVGYVGGLAVAAGQIATHHAKLGSLEQDLNAGKIAPSEYRSGVRDNSTSIAKTGTGQANATYSFFGSGPAPRTY